MDPIAAIRPDELRAAPSMVLATLPPAMPVAAVAAPGPVPELASLAPPAVESALPTYVQTSSLAARRATGAVKQFVRLEPRRAPSRQFISAFPAADPGASRPAAGDMITAGYAAPAAIDAAPAGPSDILELQIQETATMAQEPASEPQAIAPTAEGAMPAPEFGVLPTEEPPAADLPAVASEQAPG